MPVRDAHLRQAGEDSAPLPACAVGTKPRLTHMVMQVPVRRAPAASGKGKAATAAAATKGYGKGAAPEAEGSAPKAVPKRKPAAKTVQEVDSASVDSPVVVPQVIATPSVWAVPSPPTCLNHLGSFFL